MVCHGLKWNIGMQWDDVFGYAVERCFWVCSGTMFLGMQWNDVLGMQWDDVFRYAVGRCF